ncbi:CaiB/BaiF CoA transferase family protein [Capillimicrobium parvum]|uniref:Succinyl-CoA--L-malate CoA-transferase beta subunit n=1 Tax=Capillimicrobium parvum TaxID=2884022 RepID=A0A9E7C6Q0_9ACTN|nr:CoA transferase [Capillimicrobium parvum]UGS39104.1 Succinyl-CoA--L-malate CoA-transferase beta subunit [Capillimicrobium parvum]
MNPTGELPLKGIRVVDSASLFAGPVIATMLGDYGADVIKVEHPEGDNLRKLGWEKDGVSLWWAVIGRNKRSVTLKLSDPDGAEAMKKLLATADIYVENFRTGTLERWGLGWDVLKEINPNLVMVRTTGFGQTGPYATRPGFGTLAESMSGYAHINGFPDGPPTLPPFALGDGVAAMTGAFAAMMALWWRDRGGTGQVIDLSIYEPLFWILGPQASVYDQLGIVQNRTGNRAPFTSPRNAYLSKDGVWLGMSASAQSIAERVMKLVGRADLAEQPWFSDHAGRLEHQDELDEPIAAWIAERDADEVLLAFEEVHAAIAPVLSIKEIFEDPQFQARETITTVEHPVLGPLKMQNVIPRLTMTPGEIRWCGPDLGSSNRDVLGGELGYSDAELADLAARGVIAQAP